MTYDYHGSWDPLTGLQSGLYGDPAAPDYGTAPWSNCDSTITYLLAQGVPSTKLLLGIPLYGRGWSGVNDGGVHGLYQAATGWATGSRSAGEDDYSVLRNWNGTLYMSNITRQSWKYNNSSKVFWTYDTAEVVGIKVSYSKNKTLRGLFSWSVDGDTVDGEIMSVMAGFV